jgi:hypothetical protein
MQHPMELQDRGRREPCLDPPCIELGEMGRFELAEPQAPDIRVGVEPEELPVPLVRPGGDGWLDDL